ncbi:MAG: HD domain-containing phosphohydrolase [Anaerolineales bacterium]
MLENPETTSELIGRTLDMAIVMGSATLGFWNVLLWPIASSNIGQPMLERAILLAYPIGDLVLLGAFLIILYNPSRKQGALPIFLLAGSLLAVIITDCIYSYQSLLGKYVSGGLLDLGWVVGSLLTGLAGVSQWVAGRSIKINERVTLVDVFRNRFRTIQPYITYFWPAAVFFMLIGGEMGLIPLPMGVLPFSLGAVGIIILVVNRQFITLTENNKLNSRLQISMDRIQAQAAELEKTNLELQTDIAERKRAEEALHERGTQLTEALRIARMAYWEYDVIHDQFKFNDQFYTLFHTTAEQEGGYSMSSARYAQRFVHPDDAALVGVEIRKALETTDPEYQSELDHRIIRADGETGYLSVHIRIEKDAQGRTVRTRGVNQDITGRKQAEAALQQSEALFRTLFELSPDAIVLIDPHDPNSPWPIVDCNAAACLMNGYTRDEMIGQSIDIINLAPSGPVQRSAYMDQMRKGGINRFITQHRRKDGTVFFVDVSNTLFTVGGRDLLLGIDHDITDRNRREEEIKHRLAELEAINKVSSDLRAAQTLEEILPLLLDTILDVMHAAQGSIWLYDPIKGELDPVATRGFEAQTGMPPLPSVKPGAGIAGRVFASGQPYVSGDFQLYPNLSKSTRQLIPPGVGGAAIPIRAEENILGTIIVNVPLPRELTPDEVHLLTTLSEIAGIAIRRTSLRQQTDRRLRHLTALSEISRVITSSVDLRLNLTMLLNQVIAQLGIDAADVLLLNSILRTLDYAAGSGFRTRTVERAHQRMDEGYAGRAILEGHILYVPNLVERDDNPLLAKTLAGESFVSYYAVPLMAKGQIKGVLEIFHRVPHEHDAEWLDFLNTLAEQAAIAIDNVTLFDNLQRSNIDLTLAYDATIEGWSHALDLRDKETEGHTQRVMEISIKLSRESGLSEADLVQVRWGALLHDIGKMGVPDTILFKPGPLTDEEWKVMRMHPQFAYDMLAPIAYLRSALDIPYCHHEKWDGTGYPRGLKAEQIPLTARLFAAVDVWDALRSDRPYRPAWPEEKVREYIRSLAGTHLDPKAVAVFLKVMSENA